MNRTRFYHVLFNGYSVLKELNLGNSSSHWSKHKFHGAIFYFYKNDVMSQLCMDSSLVWYSFVLVRMGILEKFNSIQVTRVCHMGSQTWTAKQNDGRTWLVNIFFLSLLPWCFCVHQQFHVFLDLLQTVGKMKGWNICACCHLNPLGFASEAHCYSSTHCCSQVHSLTKHLLFH